MGTELPRLDAVDDAALSNALCAQSNPTRRLLLAYLDERGDAVAFSDIVEDVAATLAERGTSSCLSDEDSVAVRLHHVHLPKLEAAGLVEVADGPTGREVSLSDDVQRVRTEPVFLCVDE